MLRSARMRAQVCWLLSLSCAAAFACGGGEEQSGEPSGADGGAAGGSSASGSGGGGVPSVVDDFDLDPTWYRDVSPGTVEFRLVLDATTAYCEARDQCTSPGHVEVRRSDASLVGVDSFVGCTETSCSTCSTTPCLGIACPPEGAAISGTLTRVWDGATRAPGTCDNVTPCVAVAYVPPGDYVAVMCATPGEPSADGTTCENAQPQQCVEVPFALPGDAVVEGAL